MPSPNELLKKYWGHDSLRPAQEQVIKHLHEQKDVIALLPTGGGKSICFQIPALQREGLCLVISPLISLMQDQVKSLQDRGIKAMMLGGSLSYKELLIKLDNCQYGNYKFLYLSPERLQQEIIIERLPQMNLSLVAIDEAHCISEWGHDFRPAYRKINILKELFTNIPFIALTATATDRVLQDIKENLLLETAELVKMSFARNNIALLVKKSEDKNYVLQQFLKQNKDGVAIIYVRSRKLTLTLKNILNNYGISAEAYHGGMTADKKKELLTQWQAEKFSVMVATNAFGMGIDKANVRQVVHYHLPDSLESYYQEVGRAGRDEKPAQALLIYNNDDILKLKDQFLKNAPTPEKTKLIYKKLCNYLSIAYGEGQEKIHNFNFLNFCQTYGFNTYLAYNILRFLDQLDVLSLSREFNQRTALSFKITNRNLYTFLEQHIQFKTLVHSLLRMQGGFFDFKTTVNIKALQEKTKLSRTQINTLLQKLEKLDVIDLTLADQDATVVFLVPREDNITINPLIPYLKKYYRNKKHKIDEVINYIEEDRICKTIYLLQYFGEIREKPCEKCSVCQKEITSPANNLKRVKQIRKAIAQALIQKELDSKTLTATLPFSEDLILFTLKIMVDKKEVVLTAQNTYIIPKQS